MIGRDDFHFVVKTYAPHLLRFARRVGGNTMEPADILQECFEALWKNREKVQEGSVRSFLFTVAHRRIVDSYRSSDPETLSLENLFAQSSPDQFKDLEIKEVIIKGLEKLDVTFRELIVLRDLEGYNYEEIGKICDLNESQVKVYLFRARKRLKEIITELDSLYENHQRKL